MAVLLVMGFWRWYVAGQRNAQAPGRKKNKTEKKKKTLVSRMSGKTWEGQKGGHEA